MSFTNIIINNFLQTFLSLCSFLNFAESNIMNIKHPYLHNFFHFWISIEISQSHICHTTRSEYISASDIEFPGILILSMFCIHNDYSSIKIATCGILWGFGIEADSVSWSSKLLVQLKWIVRIMCTLIYKNLNNHFLVSVSCILTDYSPCMMHPLLYKVCAEFGFVYANRYCL
jgi:hypothetical protein